MARRKPSRKEDVLSTLSGEEALGVLRALLQAHPELVDEARRLATERLVRIDRVAMADALVATLDALGFDELNARAGRHRHGYVEPTEAAWHLLDESLEPFRAELDRLLLLGMDDAAQEQCEGILLGLYAMVHEHSDNPVLQNAPDFCNDAAMTLLERWMGGSRPLDEDFVREELSGWASWIERRQPTGRR